MGGPVIGIVYLMAVVQPVIGAQTSENSAKRLTSVGFLASKRFGRSRLSRDRLCTLVAVLSSHTSNTSLPGIAPPNLIPL